MSNSYDHHLWTRQHRRERLAKSRVWRFVEQARVGRESLAGRGSEAYWTGWMDGRFGERDSFAENPSLARWEAPSERLDYYRGHRAGKEARRDSAGSNSDAREKLFG